MIPIIKHYSYWLAENSGWSGGELWFDGKMRFNTREEAEEYNIKTFAMNPHSDTQYRVTFVNSTLESYPQNITQ